MHNITVTVSDEAYRRARIWAAQQDSSLSKVVQYILEHLHGLPLARGYPNRDVVPACDPETMALLYGPSAPGASSAQRGQDTKKTENAVSPKPSAKS